MTNREAIHKLIGYRRFIEKMAMTIPGYIFDAEPFDLAISALEKQEADRWIPVTERLPKKDCKCRVTEGDFKSVIDCCWNNYQKQFEVWNYYHDDYMPITNVTAWKPIEAPYTEEEA